MILQLIESDSGEVRGILDTDNMRLRTDDEELQQVWDVLKTGVTLRAPSELTDGETFADSTQHVRLTAATLGQFEPEILEAGYELEEGDDDDSDLEDDSGKPESRPKKKPKPKRKGKDADRPTEQHIAYQGMKLCIEQPVGSTRSGTADDGEKWDVEFAIPYGYIEGTTGADGDSLDCFVGPDHDSDMVYVIHQNNLAGEYDEDKVMLGFTTRGDAKQAYFDHYDRPEEFFDSLDAMTLAKFKRDYIDSNHQTRALDADLPAGGAWRTIRGAHVYIVNGRIAAGPKHLMGKNPDDLGKGPQRGPMAGKGTQTRRGIALKAVAARRHREEREREKKPAEVAKPVTAKARPVESNKEAQFREALAKANPVLVHKHMMERLQREDPKLAKRVRERAVRYKVHNIAPGKIEVWHQQRGMVAQADIVNGKIENVKVFEELGRLPAMQALLDWQPKPQEAVKAGPMKGKGTRTRRAIALKAVAARRAKMQQGVQKEIAKRAPVQAQLKELPPDVKTGEFRNPDSPERETHIAGTEVVGEKRLGGGVTVTKIVIFKNGSKGVFKPQSGDPKQRYRQHITPGKGTEREALAWDVAKLVGIDDLVTPCVIREVNGERGAVLDWQDGIVAMKEHSTTRRYDGMIDAARAAAFDFVIGNTDRHEGNWLVGTDGRLKLIDHGLSFPESSEISGNRRLMSWLKYNEDAGKGVLRPADLAAPYAKNRGKILSAIEKMGLPPAVYDGVEARIDALANSQTWAQAIGEIE